MLRGMGDKHDDVRATCMSLGRVLMDLYGLSEAGLLLEHLHAFLLDAHWRCRLASIDLLSVIFKKISADVVGEDAAFLSKSKIEDVIGSSWMRRILSSVFLLRQDVALQVRQSSAAFWKSLIVHTPRLAACGG